MDADRHRRAHRSRNRFRLGLAHSDGGRPRRVGVSAAGRALLTVPFHRAVAAAPAVLRAALRQSQAGDLLEVSAGDVAAPRAGSGGRSAGSADRRDERAERRAPVRGRAATCRRRRGAPHVAALGHVVPGAVLPRYVPLRSADEPRVARHVVGRVAMGRVGPRARSRHRGGGAGAVRHHASAHGGGARARGGGGAAHRAASCRRVAALHQAGDRHPVRRGARRCERSSACGAGGAPALRSRHAARAVHAAVRPVRRARVRRARRSGPLASAPWDQRVTSSLVLRGAPNATRRARSPPRPSRGRA